MRKINSFNWKCSQREEKYEIEWNAFFNSCEYCTQNLHEYSLYSFFFSLQYVVPNSAIAKKIFPIFLFAFVNFSYVWYIYIRYITIFQHVCFEVPHKSIEIASEHSTICFVQICVVPRFFWRFLFFYFGIWYNLSRELKVKDYFCRLIFNVTFLIYCRSCLSKFLN